MRRAQGRGRRDCYKAACAEAFEQAEIATGEAERQRLLNFVIVGAGLRG
jgi:NADH dehydrogenase FAD-containing subunit